MPVGDAPDWRQDVAIDTVLAYQTNIALAPGGVSVFFGDVMDYATLLLCTRVPAINYRVAVFWYTAKVGGSPLTSDMWECPTGMDFRAWAPVAGRTAAIWLYGAAGSHLADFMVYGVRVGAPDSRLISNKPLAHAV